jgi:hypothetical protein
VINETPSGANRNCPNEPAAVPAPNDTERHCSGTSLPNAETMRLNEQPDNPKPISTPTVRLSVTGVVE